ARRAAAPAPARTAAAEPVPLHLRNAPTGLMKSLDYGKGYRYAHSEADGVAPDMPCLPPAHKDPRVLCPPARGQEIAVNKQLNELRARREGDVQPPSSDDS